MSHVRNFDGGRTRSRSFSGAISTTVNLPNDASIDAIAKDLPREGWRLGLKAVALVSRRMQASQGRSDIEQESKDDALEAGRERREDTIASEGRFEAPQKLPLNPRRTPRRKTSSTLALRLNPPGNAPSTRGLASPKKRMGFTAGRQRRWSQDLPVDTDEYRR